MKKNTISKAIIAGTIGLIALSSCALAATPLTRFVNAASEAQTETASFDESNTLNVVDIAMMISPEFESSEADLLTNEEKIQAIVAARTFIIDTQQAINEIKPEMRDNINELKILRDAFIDQDLTLEAAERTWLLDLRSQLVTIRSQAQATIGKVYQALNELRGQYQLSNLDLIYDVYIEAKVHMETRLSLVTSLNAIIIEVKDFLTIKVG